MTVGPAPGPAAARHASAVPTWGRLAGTAVGVVAFLCLAVGAVHGVRTTAALSDGAAVASGRLDVAYYDCLATQAHSLVGPGQTVVLSMANPGDWATLGKVVAPWARVSRDAGRATAVLSLEPKPGPGSCLGDVVVARYPSGATRRGTGASLPGSGPPPATPL